MKACGDLPAASAAELIRALSALGNFRVVVAIENSRSTLGNTKVPPGAADCQFASRLERQVDRKQFYFSVLAHWEGSETWCAWRLDGSIAVFRVTQNLFLAPC